MMFIWQNVQNNSGSFTEDPDEFLFNGLGGPSR